MLDLNRVVITGRLTKDPELKMSQGNNAYLNFTVAANREFCPKGKDKISDFIECIAFGKSAEFIAKYFSKGSAIFIDGEINTGKYQNKKYPDVTHYTTSVKVNQVKFIESKPSISAPAARGEEPVRTAYVPAIEDNSLGDFEEVIGEENLPF